MGTSDRRMSRVRAAVFGMILVVGGVAVPLARRLGGALRSGEQRPRQPARTT